MSGSRSAGASPVIGTRQRGGGAGSWSWWRSGSTQVELVVKFEDIANNVRATSNVDVGLCTQGK
jgi:hypothetical protein